MVDAEDLEATVKEGLTVNAVRALKPLEIQVKASERKQNRVGDADG